MGFGSGSFGAIDQIIERRRSGRRGLAGSAVAAARVDRGRCNEGSRPARRRFVPSRSSSFVSWAIGMSTTDCWRSGCAGVQVTSVDLAAIEDDVAVLFGLDEFEQVSFSLAEEDGRRGLVFQMQEKSWGPFYLRGDLALRADLDGETGVGLLLNLTRTRAQ